MHFPQKPVWLWNKVVLPKIFAQLTYLELQLPESVTWCASSEALLIETASKWNVNDWMNSLFYWTLFRSQNRDYLRTRTWNVEGKRDIFQLYFSEEVGIGSPQVTNLSRRKIDWFFVTSSCVYNAPNRASLKVVNFLRGKVHFGEKKGLVFGWCACFLPSVKWKRIMYSLIKGYISRWDSFPQGTVGCSGFHATSWIDVVELPLCFNLLIQNI